MLVEPKRRPTHPPVKRGAVKCISCPYLATPPPPPTITDLEKHDSIFFFSIVQLYTPELPIKLQFQWNSWIKCNCLFDLAQCYEVSSNNIATVRPINIENALGVEGCDVACHCVAKEGNAIMNEQLHVEL